MSDKEIKEIIKAKKKEMNRVIDTDGNPAIIDKLMADINDLKKKVGLSLREW